MSSEHDHEKLSHSHPEHQLAQILKSDAQLSKNPPDLEKWNKVASSQVIEKTKKNMEAKFHEVFVVENGQEALEVIKSLVPKGSSVNNGGSMTLHEVGYTDWAVRNKEIRNFHSDILAEKDMMKQWEMRRHLMAPDFWFTSASAVSENGEMIFVDASGTRTGPISFSAKNVVVVIGANKITPTYEEAVKRIQEFAVPVENARIRDAYKMPGTTISTTLTISGGVFISPKRFKVIIVKEAHGY